jgi:hypothetical protein
MNINKKTAPPKQLISSTQLGGESTVSLKTVYNWFNKFDSGDMSLEEKEGCG